MFYTDKMDSFLRFGDVVKGYISPSTLIKKPVLKLSDIESYFNIRVEVPTFSVVMTPCCSIGETMICLTPLISLRKDFFKNPNFIADFTIINREIEPEKCFPPEEWEKMDGQKREEIEARRVPYTLLYLFVYEEHDIFSKYPIRGTELRYYMVDFRNIYTIKCDMIQRPEKIGHEYETILESKCLQLSDSAREELRNKMAYYFGRNPEEQELKAMVT